MAVHAEDPASLREPAGTGWRDFVASRPVEAELRAIETAIELARETGCSLHVVHVSTARGVDLVAQSDATCETCPHYLALTEDDLETLGTRAKCAPPLRTAAERDALRERLGGLAFIASDHSPCPPDMKRGDFTAAWGGIAGCQTLLPILLDLGVEDVVRLTSRGPAERLRLPKGGIAPGADADLVLVDLEDRHAPELHDRHRLSPFAGRALRGRVVRTLVRGTTVFHDGRIVAEPLGRLLTPTKGRPCMSDLRITAGPFEFGADWVADAPKTRAAFEAMLPFRNKIIHVRWSGESAWIPLGDLETNCRSRTTRATRRRARSLYPGGFSETEILFPYGGTCFASIVGQLAGNHFLTVTEGRENLRELGRTVLWEGAQDVVFEA